MRSAYLHLPVMVDVQEALPELDNLQGHKQGDGNQVGIQNPEGDHEDDPVDSTTLVVTLYMQISILADSITTGSTCHICKCDNLTDCRFHNNVSNAVLNMNCFSQCTMQHGKGNPVQGK